ncbi:hypothetical protein NQ166_04040 [Microbacterium sp. zg.Y1090]|uniref:sugar-binding domain-containing protein n=1 Tax=Microbacterium wangruii TaxID=3049073 RepID=UPI00214B50BF|nr:MULTISPECIES: sugar-binding domain-containing protein [unclassified Microbacterium]MCR2818000.1 hypothetical protein [Microbacterium sp. zg.Y1090]MDL5488082.1 glycoside hydrolase family 2 TIM barrel-domain containing protein [Microbacterium sp. zg-Y1211]WIM27838.1 glycoside hydrolase family 2 TIM barrel-domain containing protein [Microbacterium sp. zg-Y1090]
MPSHPRRRLRLDGTWTLHLPDGATADVTVPGAWTAQIPGAGDAHDTVRYERRFDGEAADAERRWVLRFDAVNHHARVVLNGILLGEHEGAWMPFEFDATAAMRAGENILEVTVSYPPRVGDDGEPGFLERPLGKQSWYGTTAGIWQSVRLEERHDAHVRRVSVRADAAAATLDVSAEVTPAVAAGREVHVVVSRGGDVQAEARLHAAGDRHRATVHVDGAERWDLDSPVLYDVRVEVREGDAVVDAVERSTGFREFTAADGRFHLNGREIYLRAVLDQDYHPGSQPMADDFAQWEELLRQTRALGFNMLRVHIKRPDPRYYDIADRLGMLVWTELPSWMTWTRRGAQEARALLHDIVAEDVHHPSIVMWTIMNESWGVDLSQDEQRSWLRGMYEEFRAELPGHVIVDNSACAPNFHLRTQVDDYHLYRGIPESRREWDSKIAEFAGRPAWTFSPYGDAVRTGEEPLMLSEFGNWGLPDVREQYIDGEEPWWFALGAGWAFGAADATGLRDRFVSLGLDGVFGSWEELLSQLQRAQSVANRYQTTSIRLHPEIRGYVLTQLSDVQWEANGLFDMNRRPKQFTSEFGMVNGEHAVALRPAAYSVFAGDILPVTVTALPGPRGAGPGARLRLLGDEAGPRDLGVVGDSPRAADVTVALPKTPGQYEIAVELVIDGAVVARDTAEVIVVAHEAVSGLRCVAGDDETAIWLSGLGVDLVTVEEPGALLVTRRFTESARHHAAAGGRVLLLAEDDGALGDAFDYLPSARLVGRAGDGDWVPRTEWLDRRGPFRSVPGEAVLGIAFEDLLGERVISGIPGPLRPAVVHSGIFSGWLRGAAASTVTIRWSEGAVTITTLRVRESASVPVARAVAQALLSAAAHAYASRAPEACEGGQSAYEEET